MNGRLMTALSGDLTLLPQDETLLANAAVGGVILFSRNYANSRQLRQLTAAIRRAAARPLLIVTDHEGGRVQRFRGDGFTSVPAMRGLADAAEADSLLHAAGVVTAAELQAHGVDMTFAPVLDLDYGTSQVIGDRAFAADGARAAALAACFTQGLAACGMPSCAKHFPGHGYTAADSHTELPTDSRRRSALQKDMLPFALYGERYGKGGACGGDSMMTAHIIFPAVDALPVTFSSRWLKNILRDELGYRGLVVSDDLCMQGAAAIGDIAARLTAAAAAGCDLLLLCQPQDNAAALAAMPAAGAINRGAAWTDLLASAQQNAKRGHQGSGISVGDAAYQEARALLAAFS